MKTVILLSTCDAYLPVAKYTERLIKRFWQNHPNLYYCGASVCPTDHYLPLNCEPRDWIMITLMALARLIDAKVDNVYLILDDHPPIGPCNDHFLNALLPRWFGENNVLRVSLKGWDQSDPAPGKLLESPNHLLLFKDHPAYGSRFDLHPALWNAEKLYALLSLLKEQQSTASSARDFEILSKELKSNEIAGFSDQCYRVSGDHWASGMNHAQDKRARKRKKNRIHIKRFLLRLARMEHAAAAYDKKNHVYMQYCNGPYPIYWSGLLRKGQKNHLLLRYLRLSGQIEFMQELETELSDWKIIHNG